MFRSQKCPICLTEVERSRRYPHYVCQNCRAKSVDENNRSVKFHNESLSGGFLGFYSDTNEKYDSHICYIDSVRCWADEAHFGGIVIEADKITFRKIIIKGIGNIFEKLDIIFQNISKG